MVVTRLLVSGCSVVGVLSTTFDSVGGHETSSTAMVARSLDLHGAPLSHLSH